MEEVEEFLKPQKVFFLDTNLSSPVLLHEIERTRCFVSTFYATETDQQKRHRLTAYERNRHSFFKKLVSLRGWKRKTLTATRPLNPEKYPELEHDMLVANDRLQSRYDKAKELCQLLEDAVRDGLRSRGLPQEEILGTTSCLGDPVVIPYRQAYESFSDLFGRSEERIKTSEHIWTHGCVGQVDFWVHQSMGLIGFRGDLYHTSLNQILMLKDKLSTRYMLLEHVLPLGLPRSLHTHLRDLFHWQDSTLSRYGNEAYSVLKAVEPLFKTRLSHMSDNVFGEDTAYRRMVVKMREKESGMTKGETPSIDSLCELVERVETITEVVEMFGCQKSCGHPLIDPARGGLSAAAEAISPDTTSLVDAQQLRNTFCHIVLQSYVSQHGVWPKLIYMRKGTRLESLNVRQSRNITYNSYDLSDWTYVEWTKFLDFDYFPNFLELMDDKSISLYRSDKHLTWDRGRKPKSNRRLLLEVLNSKDVNVEKIVKQVSRRDVPDDWKIVSLYPKEREFKLDPRMFSMMVLEMRCFFTAIEANIAHGVFRYLPQQTMTKTKTQNQERFLSFTDPTRRGADSVLFIEIDLTRWNLRWREMAIHMIGHDLNRIYGVKGTFTVTHWFFRQCQIVVRVQDLRPEGIELENPPITPLAWRDHKGGFEGINQKLWSAATYAMVEMALAPLLKDGTLTSYELIGQGDNQVVRLAVPLHGRTREEVLPGVRDLVNERLEKTCRSVNQIVKPDENIESTSVLTYSKDVYVKGVEYPTSLKKHSRLFPVTSLDFPSVASNTRAILAGAVAAAENSKYPLRSAIVGWYHSLRYLISVSCGKSIHGKEVPTFTDTDLLGSMILPSSIGGMTGVCLASFLYKGGSDPLGKEISGLRLIAESQSIVGRIATRALAGLEQRYYVEEKPDMSILIDNPYGLPLAKPTSPLSRVSHLTLDAFTPMVRNRAIQPLLGSRVATAEKSLKDDLLGMRPLNPLLIHDMYEASAFGSIKLMRKMFLNTRTVQSIAQQVNPNITHVFLRADLNDIKFYLRWLRGLPDSNYSGRSTFELVKQFRSYWGVDLHGVTNHQPLDCLHFGGTTRHASSIKWSAHSTSDVFTTRGPLSGYLGSATREKRSEHGYKLVDTGSPSRSLMKLQLIRSQAYGNPDFNLLVDKIGLTRSPVVLSEITDLLQKVYGGSLSHRYASVMRTLAASYVGPLNLVTHVRLDTDTVGQISGSTLNYPIMLQEYMVLCLSIAKMCLHHWNTRMGELVIPTHEFRPLEDDAISCSTSKFQVQTIPETVLTYSPSITLTRTQDVISRTLPRGTVVPPDEYSNMDCLEETLVAFFFHTLRDQNRAKIIADTRGIMSVPARYQLDIAEAHAFGPRRVLRCIAYAVVMTSVRDTFRTITLHPERWDESLFMAHNISVCLKSVSNYWKHPLFAGHPDAQRLRSSDLRYAGPSSLMKRLEARVRRTISVVVTTFDHPLWSSRIPIHSGENPTQVVEALSLSGALSIMKLRIIGDPKTNLFSSLFAAYTRPTRGVVQKPEAAIELICTRLFRLSRAYRKEGDEGLADTMVRISQMRKLALYNDDIRTVLRHARSITPEVPPPLQPAIRPVLTGIASPNTHCPECWPADTTKELAQWSRYVHRRNGGFVSSGYTWIHLLPELTVLRSVLIIGSGNGGLADLLLTVFNCEVIGSDLEQDMPRDTATLLNYVPLGVQPENRTRYTQSDLSITTSGDWCDWSVRKALLDSLPTTSTVFVDATGPGVNALCDGVRHCLSHKSVERCYVRLIGTKAEIVDGYRSLSTDMSVRLWVLASTRYSAEVIVEAGQRRLTHHVCTGSPLLSFLTVTEDQHSLIPTKRSELLEAATMSVFSWNDETLPEVYHAVTLLCRSLTNKPRHLQLTYSNRISLIIAHAVMTAVTSEDPAGTIREWIDNEELETTLFRLKLNSTITTHLIKYTARLSSIT